VPDKTQTKDLETVLARLKHEWQELADLLTSQSKSQERVIEVEKILFRDASGKYRGKISATPDGSAGLLLSDHEGNAWAWLGVNQDGEAFLELKDKNGEIRFKVPVGASSPEAGAGLAAAPDHGLHPEPLASPGAVAQPIMPDAAGGVPPGGSGSVLAPPTPDPDAEPGCNATAMVFDRLEKLERQHRRQKFYRALILVVLGVILATQTFLLIRPHLPGPLEVEALVVRHPNGVTRAWLGDKDGKVGLHLWDRQGTRRATMGLGLEGAPGLTLYDQDQRVRAELNLEPDGEPKFTLRDKRSLLSQPEPTPPGASGRQQPLGGTVPGAKEGAAAGPPAAQEEAVSPNREAEAEVEYVGSITSNKYHYPTCRLARTISPARVIKFKSAAEAQERRYIPCPVCKPPPLSR